jgi:hypothetical protein
MPVTGTWKPKRQQSPGLTFDRFPNPAWLSFSGPVEVSEGRWSKPSGAAERFEHVFALSRSTSPPIDLRTRPSTMVCSGESRSPTLVVRNIVQRVTVPSSTFIAANSVVVHCACNHESCSRPALLHRQAGLGSIERLDLALLVDGKDNGVRRRIDIEPDHVAQLVDERGVFGELELPDAVWLKSVGAPDALHGGDADAGCLRHRCARPMRGFGHRRLHCQRHDAFGDSGIKLRDARMPRLVAPQPFKALAGKACCQRQTQVLDLLVSRMIALVPTPSALSKTIHARQTCF